MMHPPVTRGLDALTDRERQTLRLVGRGYDAKSLARELGLSVHTVNERLREARRKLGVSSSREAARMLAGSEEAPPELLGDKRLGDAATAAAMPAGAMPDGRHRSRMTRALVLAGVLAMSLLIAFLALAPLAQDPAGSAPSAASATAETDASRAARQWLALVDAYRWKESFATTTRDFHKLNTVKLWTDVSLQVRVPLGAAQSRVFVDDQEAPNMTTGYRMVRFRTRFAGGGEKTETLTLVQEDGAWRIGGYVIG